MIKLEMSHSHKMGVVFWLGLLLNLLPVAETQVPKTYDMDEKATCGRSVFVDDSGVRLNGRGNVAPSNPPKICIVYLQSVYANDDGSNKLQVEVENLQIKDCNVELYLYNGRNSVGRALRVMSCQYNSAGIFYSTNREVTVKLTLPEELVHNEYQYTLLIKPWKDNEVPGTQSGVSSLSVAAIIGIIIGCLVLIALIILFLWCCCTGRLGDFNIPGRSFIGSFGGMGDKRAAYEKSNAEIMKVKDPIVWNSQTDTLPQNPRAPRLYQRRNQINYDRRFNPEDDPYVNDRQDVYRSDSRWRREPKHDYEPYEVESVQNELNKRKETLIDDVFEEDSATKNSEIMDGSDITGNETLQKRSIGERQGSPKSQHSAMTEDTDIRESPHLESQPDQETIASPHHVNAGIRASVEDLESSPKKGMKRKDKTDKKSPKSKRKEVIPPEAFEPIFTAPISGIDYKSGTSNQPYGYPGYPAYGLMPAGMFAPGVPGTQTYAYAYQTVPPGGMPGQQGAWVVQNTPTADGNRRTAYVMEETPDPRGKRGKQKFMPQSSDKKQHRDLVSRTPFAERDGEPDLSMVMRGAAPTDPGHGHRSVAMKSGTDPASGIHTTQVVWTDTAPDPSDPKPGENPQVTRKTVTRVTTKSGYGDLPPSSDPLMMLDGEDEPAFLSPGRAQPQSKQNAILQAPSMPSTRTPDKENIDFYTGPPYKSNDYNHSVPPPERTSTPQFTIHQHPSYNSAIRDRIPFDDSTV